MLCVLWVILIVSIFDPEPIFLINHLDLVPHRLMVLVVGPRLNMLHQVHDAAANSIVCHDIEDDCNGQGRVCQGEA